MNYETCYLGHSNSIDIVLKSQGATSTSSSAVDLTTIDWMSLTFGSVVVTSTNNATQAIRWAKAGYVTGECRLFLGEATMATGAYDAPLIVYDAGDTTLGIMWGYIPIRVKSDPEGT